MTTTTTTKNKFVDEKKPLDHDSPKSYQNLPLTTSGDSFYDTLSNSDPETQKFMLKLALIASMSGLLFGYDTGVVSGAIIFLRSDMDLNNVEVEVLVASTILAAAFSAWFGDHLLDDLGRKRTLVVSSVIFIIGSLIMGAAAGPYHGYYMLLLGRIIVGVAIGFASEAGPLYISECAPPDLRGSLTTLFNVAVVGGQVFASVLCGMLSYLPESYSWRLMLAFGAVPAFAQMAGFMSLPLSPTWLVVQGRTADAERVLYKIRGGTVPPSHGDHENDDEKKEEPVFHNTTKHDPVQQELEEIIEEHETAKKGADTTLWEMWCNPTLRRSMILGCCLWAASQLAGINTIMYYGASIVRRTGLEGDRSFDIWVTVPLNMMQLFGIFVCYTIIDKQGRRPTLLFSMTCVWIGLFSIGVGFWMDSGAFTVFAMCFYLFSFGVGLSTMPYTLNAEIYPTEYRGKCVAQSTAIFWFSNFLVSLTFLSMARWLGNHGVFFFYTVIVILSEVWFYINMPETAGKSFHEIQAMFALSEQQHALAAAAAAGSKTNYGSLPTDDIQLSKDGDRVVVVV